MEFDLEGPDDDELACQVISKLTGTATGVTHSGEIVVKTFKYEESTPICT